MPPPPPAPPPSPPPEPPYPKPGERLTLTYATRPSSSSSSSSARPLALHVDIYPFTPTPSSTSRASSFPPRLPFVLFLHSSPSSPFFGGSYRDVPAWLMSMCCERGWPLLSAEYRLCTPSARDSPSPSSTGVQEAWEDIHDLWRFIQLEEEQGAGLNWCISCAGIASEVDTGPVGLSEGLRKMQDARGIDGRMGCVVAGGAGAYFAALAGALLDPPPISLVLTTPILDPTGDFYNTPRSNADPRRLQTLLSRLQSQSQTSSPVVTSSSSSHSSPSSASLRRKIWPTRSTSTAQQPSPWWNHPVPSPTSKDHQAHARTRTSLYRTALQCGKISDVLSVPSTLTLRNVLDDDVRSRHPSVLILSADFDTYVDPRSYDVYRDLVLDPVARVFDDLLLAGLAKRQRVQDTPRTRDSELFDPARRFIHRTVPHAHHAFHASALRQDSRFQGEFDAVEAFLHTAISLASTPHSSTTTASRRRAREKL